MAAAIVPVSPVSFALSNSSPHALRNLRKPSSPILRSNICHRLSQKRKLVFNVSCSAKLGEKSQEDVTKTSDENFPSPDDADYLMKLAAGSVGGGAAIKYGSILFPDFTRPNILEALLMISLPVAVAVVILIKESMSANKDDML